MFATPRSKYFFVFVTSLVFVFTSTLLFSQNTVTADVVALDQPWMFNRLGTAQPTGMIFALKRDVVAIDIRKGLVPGNVKLREGKRPRPLVLRANEGDNLVINFTNLLTPFNQSQAFKPYSPLPDSTLILNQKEVNQIYPATRWAGLHIMGVEMESSILSDGSWVGSNGNSLVPPIRGKNTITYSVICPKEGSYLLYSTAANVAEANLNGAQIANGLFGCLAVEPLNAEWYRSQVTQADLWNATRFYMTESGKRINKSNPTADGLNPPGFPIINYDTIISGTPVLKMYTEDASGNRTLVYSDLTAIITGPSTGSDPYHWSTSNRSAVFDSVWVTPDRRRPFREFAIHYHEATLAVQAFPIFYDGSAAVVDLLKGGPDNFAINYGTGGIGAEIYANRIGVGPMADCVDCAYEEFFLSAWAVGDPAMVVDVPANASGKSDEEVNLTLNNDLIYMQLKDSANANVKIDTSAKAKRVLYPDDPSNVYNSYMSDHLKFRLNHGGAGITHVHHQHQHQWLHTPNDDDGHYLDSQTLNPGTSYTLEMVHHGSGNLNRSVGDQIFHCHFYPHFAQGMWGMWRVHDVLELGTVLKDGIPVSGSRALPDYEIKTGTPIPAIVPIPSLAMAPLPAKVSIVDGQVVVEDTTIHKNPGFPFFIPGIAGKRPPHPPLDFAEGTLFNTSLKPIGVGLQDGGLPRGVIADGVVLFENHTGYDWTKLIDSLTYIELPHKGTPIEQIAMRAHATLNHPTRTPDGKRATFLLNGKKAVSGAPYANPYVNAESVVKLKNPPKEPRIREYHAANIQIDVVFNKSGWHYPQQRMITLLDDIKPTVEGERPPQPFFFRANSFDVVKYHHTNLIPEYYELDDFQPRTPTDIIGQHIHLVKFDVTSSDGAANGFNYEDGTFSTNSVQERIKSINKMGGALQYQYVNKQPITNIKVYNKPKKKPLTLLGYDPSWGKPPAGQDWKGAQTTIQRWYADPLYNNGLTDDRTLRTVFTHDHFGPSTHQQAGLYAGLLVEPDSTTWLDAETGVQMGNRRDGGPTSWQALIIYPDKDRKKSYREFALEFQDTQLGYFKESKDTVTAYPEYFSGTKPYNGKTSDGKRDTIYQLAFGEYVDSTYRGWLDPDNVFQNAGHVELVSTGGQGTMSLNYRNEPLPLRANFTARFPPPQRNMDMAFAFTSNTDWADQALREQPTLGARINPASTCTGTHSINNPPHSVAYCFKYPSTALTTQMEPGDPFTPLLRAYENDRIQVRTLVGAHLFPHFFNIHGVKWLFEPSAVNSGWRSTQVMSLSEHFEMNFTLPTTQGITGVLPSDKTATVTDYLYTASADKLGLEGGIWGIMRAYKSRTPDEFPLHPLPDNVPGSPIIAPKPCGCPAGAPEKTYSVTALSISSRPAGFRNLVYNKRYQNVDTKAMVYIPTSEVTAFKTDTSYVIEPLVLRANAGDCIKVTVSNQISPAADALTTGVKYRQTGPEIGYIASYNVGLHAELLSYDVSTDDGTNVGFNKIQTVAFNDSTTYTWYAGGYEYNEASNQWNSQAIEFGAVPLLPADPLLQSFSGLFGALIIEPQGSFWKPQDQYKDAANIYGDSGFSRFLFREHVFQFQDGLSIKSTKSAPGGTFVTVENAINYRSEPLWSRFSKIPGWEATVPNFNSIDIANMLSNGFVAAAPETPTPVAKKGTPFRIRVVHPGGGGNGEVFTLHGHNWQEEPYINGSTELGSNRASQVLGSRGQIGVWNNFDILLESAGGANGVTGNYLYRSFPNGDFQHGAWGLFVVTDGNDAVMAVGADKLSNGNYKVHGYVTLDPETNTLAKSVSVSASGVTATVPVRNDGTWEFTANGNTNRSISEKSLRKGITITSSNGGKLNLTLADVIALEERTEKLPEAIPQAELLQLNKRALPSVGVKRKGGK